jgi:hypothetical protein
MLVPLSLALMQLGFAEEAGRVGPMPDFGPYLWRNDPKGLDMLESHHIDALTFFALEPLTENAARVYLLSGRGKKVADMYLSLKVTPPEFEKLAVGDEPEHFLYSAPLVALALRQNGHATDADALLSLAEARAKQSASKPVDLVLLARIYAVQGRREQALPLLVAAVNRRWIPPVPMLLADLHSDPALASLKGDRRFEKLREQIMGTIARERAQVNQHLLAQLRTA